MNSRLWKKALICILTISLLLSLVPAVSASDGTGTYYGEPRSNRQASVLGWDGDRYAAIAYPEGAFRVRDSLGYDYIGFSIAKDVQTIDWHYTEDWLPCLVSAFEKNGVSIEIKNFGDKITVNGKDYVAVYSRVVYTNPTQQDVELADARTAEQLTCLTGNDPQNETLTVPAGQTLTCDYVIVVDRFGNDYALPEASELTALGGWDAHYAHMKQYWLSRVAQISRIVSLPDEDMKNMFYATYIQFNIIKDPYTESKVLAEAGVNSGSGYMVGENGYDYGIFTGDQIEMLVTMIELGETEDVKLNLLDELDMSQLGATDLWLSDPNSSWKMTWPWAVYLHKTGDTEFVREHFADLTQVAETIVEERTGPDGVMMESYIDTLGSWVMGNWNGLLGLMSYRYICEKLGESEKEQWAQAQYDALLEVCNNKMQETQDNFHINYLSADILEPNDFNRMSNPTDANWAVALFNGRWPYEAYLMGMLPQDSVMVEDIDATYDYGFGRLLGILPQFTYGGFPGYSSAYNASYGSAALVGDRYRDVGIQALKFMLENTQNSPYGWWESIVNEPSTEGVWDYGDYDTGVGSCPHMWGQVTAVKQLMNSIIDEKYDGTLVIGRGIPDSWLTEGAVTEIADFVASGERIGMKLEGIGSNQVKLTLTGNVKADSVILDLPLFADGNLSAVSAGTMDTSNGTVTLPKGTTEVTVTVKDMNSGETLQEKNALLQEAAKLADTPKLDYDRYTPESKAELWAAYDNAMAVGNSADAATNEIRAARQRLSAAIAGLTELGEQTPLSETLASFRNQLETLGLPGVEFRDNAESYLAYLNMRDAISGRLVITDDAQLEQIQWEYDRALAITDLIKFCSPDTNMLLKQIYKVYSDEETANITALIDVLKEHLQEKGISKERLTELEAERDAIIVEMNTVAKFDKVYYSDTLYAHSIKLDGEKDAGYENSLELTINKYRDGTTKTTGAPNAEAIASLAWSDDGLYIYADITDPDRVEDSYYKRNHNDRPWKIDSFEVVLNTVDRVDDAQSWLYFVDSKGYMSFQNTAQDNNNLSYDNFLFGVEKCGQYFSAVTKPTDTGYTVEMFIPKRSEWTEGTEIALQILYNDGWTKRAGTNKQLQLEEINEDGTLGTFDTIFFNLSKLVVDYTALTKQLIDEIGTVTADSGKAIEAARNAYEALDEEQKAAITNYQVLQDAEKAYAVALAEAAAQAASEAQAAAEQAAKDAQDALLAAQQAAEDAGENKEAAENAQAAAEAAQEKAENAKNAADAAKTAAEAAAAAAENSNIKAAEQANQAAQSAAASAASAAESAKYAKAAAEAMQKAQQAQKAAEDAQKAAEAAQAAAEEAAMKAARYNATFDLALQLQKCETAGAHDMDTCISIVDKAMQDIADAETTEQVEAILAEAKQALADQICPSVIFTDVKKDAWYHEGVDYMVKNKYMQGVGNGVFDVNGRMTRAQLVTILYRIVGTPNTAETVSFTDVETGRWYSDAVAWAAANKIVLGVGNGCFDPDGEITREQIMVILYRYCTSLQLDVTGRSELTDFPDAGAVSTWACEAMQWGLAEKVITGTSEGGTTYLNPKGCATRAQAATIMMRCMENIAD